MAKVTFQKEDDPTIEAAAKRARSTFRYFWREMSWEYRRIVPAMGLAAFKVAFTDDDETPAEVMWVNEVNFDGYALTGSLLNEPNWLKSISAGDAVKVPVKAITDWLYAYDDVAYGGFSVNAIRKQMKKGERKAHDAAWGLDFGDPDKIHLAPTSYCGDEVPKKSGGLFGFGKSKLEPLGEDVLQKHEHPMAANMAPSLKEFAQKDPAAITQNGPQGINMLHQLSLAGSAVGLQTLLDCGAEVNSKSTKGHTAMDFARSLGWKQAYQLLKANGGQERARS